MKTLDLFNQNIAEINVVYSHPVKPKDRKKVTSSADVYMQLSLIFDQVVEHHEMFVIVLLDRANHILGYHKVSEGGLSGTVVDPKIIFQVALKGNASSIILAHNHPSGQMQPSEADKAITKKIKHGGEFLDIAVLDHLILTSESYYSFANDGLL